MTLTPRRPHVNAAAGADTINFSVTGTINLAAALPYLVSAEMVKAFLVSIEYRNRFGQ
jgi:hypothetical protein